LEYFWYYRPEAHHPPPSVRSPDELGDSERAAISCTQTDLSASRQRALVAEWCRLLPTLPGIRLLWLTSKVPQSLFEAACQVPGLEGLYVKWSGIRSLDVLPSAERLRYFHLGSSTSLESIDPLASCGELRWLGLENIKRITDLGPIGGLGRLQGLAVEGSTWSTQYVDTLAPIGRLTELRYLSLANLEARDNTIRPLFTLRKLQRFHAATWWDEAEREELLRLNPELL
jgi:hypothetical protein